jgi:hypothetical protein
MEGIQGLSELEKKPAVRIPSQRNFLPGNRRRRELNSASHSIRNFECWIGGMLEFWLPEEFGSF